MTYFHNVVVNFYFISVFMLGAEPWEGDTYVWVENSMLCQKIKLNNSSALS